MVESRTLKFVNYNTRNRNYQLLKPTVDFATLTYPFPFLGFLKLKILHLPFTCHFYISLLLSATFLGNNFSSPFGLLHSDRAGIIKKANIKAALFYYACFSTFPLLQWRWLAHSSNMYHLSPPILRYFLGIPCRLILKSESAALVDLGISQINVWL